LEVPGTLGDLIKNKKVVKELSISAPCPGSKYSSIFDKKKKIPDINPYLNEGFEDE